MFSAFIKPKGFLSAWVGGWVGRPGVMFVCLFGRFQGRGTN